MTDERAQLRADLEAGRWQRLTDPLLPLVLLDDPGDWWSRARAACARRMLDQIAPDDPGYELRWKRLYEEAAARLTPHAPQARRIMIRWMLDRLRRDEDRVKLGGALPLPEGSALRAAIDVLWRFAVG